MDFAPRHDWAAYEELTAESDAAWLRGLSMEQKFDLYADMFNLFWDARRERGDWERLEQWNWEQKLALRQRMVEAFRKLDEYRERTAANNAG